MSGCLAAVLVLHPHTAGVIESARPSLPVCYLCLLPPELAASAPCLQPGSLAPSLLLAAAAASSPLARDVQIHNLALIVTHGCWLLHRGIREQSMGPTKHLMCSCVREPAGGPPSAAWQQRPIYATDERRGTGTLCVELRRLWRLANPSCRCRSPAVRPPTYPRAP